MPTPLQDYREQYPQYNELTDEELAGAIRDTYYKDADPAEFREFVGLPAAEAPAKQPSTWERIKDTFSSKPKTVNDALADPKANVLEEFDNTETPEERTFWKEYQESLPPAEPQSFTDRALGLKNQFFAGWDEYRANRESTKAWDAAGDYSNIQDVARGKRPSGAGFMGDTANNLNKGLRFQAARSGDPEARQEIVQEIEGRRAELTDTLQSAIDEGNRLRERAGSIDYSGSTQEMLDAKTFGSAIGAFASDPVQIMAEISIRSLPNMVEAIPLAFAGAVAAGPAGMMAGLGAGSGMVEYRASISEFLQKNGVDINNAESLLKAAEDDQFMAQAAQYATTRSTIIGSMDAATGGLATKTIAPFAKSAFGRQLANAATQTGIQVVGGASGEALAQVGTGEELAPGEILAEGIGEGATAVIDVGIATVSGLKAQMAENEAARIQAELEDIYGRDIDPDQDMGPETPPEPPPEPGPEPTTNEDMLADLVEQYRRDFIGQGAIPAGSDRAVKQALLLERIRELGGNPDELFAAPDAPIEPDDAPAEPETDTAGDQATIKQYSEFLQTTRKILEDPNVDPDQVNLALVKMRDLIDLLPEGMQESQLGILQQLSAEFNKQVRGADETPEPDVTIEPMPPEYEKMPPLTVELLDKIRAGTVPQIDRNADRGREIDALIDRSSREELEAFIAQADDIAAGEYPTSVEMHPGLLRNFANRAQRALDRLTETEPRPAEPEAPQPAEPPEYQELRDRARLDMVKSGGVVNNAVTSMIKTIRQNLGDEFAAFYEAEVEAIMAESIEERQQAQTEAGKPEPRLDEAGKAELVRDLQTKMRKIRTLFPQEDFIGPENEQIAEMIERAQEVGVDQALIEWYELTEEEQQQLADPLPGPQTLAEAGKGVFDRMLARELEAEVSPELANAEANRARNNFINGAKDYFTGAGFKGPQGFPSASYQTGWTAAARGQITWDQPGATPPDPAENTEPVEYTDNRLKRKYYRAGLLGMSNELTVGGGGAGALIYTPEYEGDPNPPVTGRVTSANPQWFQDLVEDPEYKMSVKDVQKAITKAVKGERLGIRQKRVVTAMLDMITLERTDQPTMDFVRQELEDARARRKQQRDARALPDDPFADIEGQRYLEDEYAPEMTADARIVFELMTEAWMNGRTEAEIEALVDQYAETQLLANELEKSNDEQRRQSGIDPTETERGTGPDADLAAEIRRLGDFLQKDHEKRGLETFELLIDTQGNLAVESIVVNPEKRGQGAGTRAMKALLAAADSYGLTVVLEPAEADSFMGEAVGTTSREDLVRFYERLGFRDNRVVQNPQIAPNDMFRRPGQQAVAQPGDVPRETVERGEYQKQPGQKKLTKIQATALENARSLTAPFTFQQLNKLPQAANTKKTTVNTIQALIDKGYITPSDPELSLFDATYTVVGEEPGVASPGGEYANLPWTMSRRGEGDLYITRVGAGAGEVSRSRKSDNDLAISFDQEQLLPDYMFYLIQSLFGKLKARAKGAAQPSINMADVTDVLLDHFQPVAVPVFVLEPRDPAAMDAVTGQEFKALMYRGVGRAEQGTIYNSVAVPLLGSNATYLAYDPQQAEVYGPDLYVTETVLENPLVISNDDDFRAWHGRAGSPFYLNPFVDPSDPRAVQIVEDWSNRMLAAAQDAGHDGVVLQWDNAQPGDFSADNPAGWKRLRQVWSHPQVVAFNRPELNQVSERRRKYLNDKQLELFSTEAPVSTQANAPKLQQAKTEAIEAVKEIQSVESLVALSMSTDFAERHRTSLVGQTISTPEDLAVLAQIYRDPRFETLRAIFTNDDNQVVAQLGISSRLPAAAAGYIGNDFETYLAGLAETSKAEGATGFYLLHNHPSGDSSASMADRRLTQGYAEAIPGFKSHIIVDTNNYSIVFADGMSVQIDEDFGQPELRKIDKTAMGNLKITGAASLVKNLQGRDVAADAVTLLVTDARYTVLNIAEMPLADLKKKGSRKSKIQKATLQGQGAYVFGVSTDRGMLINLKDQMVDGIWLTEEGYARSLAATGIEFGGDVFGSREARLTPDSSEAFDYLRPLTLQRRKEAAARERDRNQYVEEEQGDLLGDDDQTKQKLADEIKKRDARRNKGQEDLETGDPGDMFSETRKQKDMFESRRGRYNPGELTREQRIEKMSMEELVSAVFNDELTGIGNLKAYNLEASMLPYQAVVDADSLKWINDNLGLDAGDAMLVAIATALDQSGVAAFRTGGDEFILGGDTPAELEAALELARGVLANQTITSPKGKSTGIQITWGIGTSKAEADTRMKAEKGTREASGERAGRGIAPPNVELAVTRPVDAQPGTNYVAMIGRHGALPITADHELILGNGRPVKIPKTPVRREHILAVMQKYFGKRIYEGRIKGKFKLGHYRPGHGEIRIKNANDIEVAAHELAHFLDDRNPWMEKLYKQFKTELKAISYDETLIFEGFAEFMRLFMTQESMAIERAPGFYDAFTKAMTEKDPKLSRMIYDLQELMHAWTMQGARARGASKMGATPASVIEKIRSYFPVNIWQSALDGLRSIKKAEIDLDDGDAMTAYEKLRLAVGGSNGVLEAAMFWGTPGWREDGQGLEFTGDGLTSIFGQFWGDDSMGMYMLARRAQELSQQGRENLMRPDEIAAWLSYENENPEAREIWDRYQEYNDRMLDFAQGAGVLSAESRAAMQEMNKNYVPFYRVVESQIEGTRVKSGGNPFMRLKGGTQNVNVIWDNVIQQNGLLIRMSMINDGKRSMLKKLGGTDKLGAGLRNQVAGLFASPISGDAVPTKIGGNQVMKAAVEALGLNWNQYQMAKSGLVQDDEEAAIVDLLRVMEEGMGEMVDFFLLNQDPSGFVDYYLDDGKKKWFEIIDPGLWDSLQFLGPKGTNMALGIFGAFSATLRRSVVAVPVFQVKNFVRDTTNAWLLSSNIKVPAARALKAVASRIEKDPAYQEMLLNGGGFANRAQGLQAQRKLIVNPLRLTAIYDRFMGRFENANRLAEYKAARAGGWSPRHSAFLSREISTDFAMRGSSGIARALAISVPFLNARAQGNYRVKRQLDHGTHAISYAMRGTAVTIATLALYALNKDDDRYEEMPEDIKDLYWVFFTGSGEDDYFLLPKPFESGMIWATIPERMMEYTEERDGKEFADAMSWMFLQTFNMDLVPQVFQPWVDIETNKNFTGAPVIPFYLENVEPTQQFQYYTSETMKQAAQKFGISPIKLETVVRGYTATLGSYALATSDAVIRQTTDLELEQGEIPTRGDTWRENILVKGLIDPLVNEGPPRRTKYTTDLYDMVREAEKVANTMVLLQKRQSDEAEAYINDPDNQFMQALVRKASRADVGSPPLANIRKQLSEIRQGMDAIRLDKRMTGDEKRQRIWELTRDRNKLAREVMQEVQKVRVELEQGLDPVAGAERVGNLPPVAAAEAAPRDPMAQASAQ